MFWTVLILLNLLSFVMMGYDKRQAQCGKQRVPEKTLFLTALLMGAVGGTLGMFKFRHKTKHWHFRLGFPALAIVQVVAVVLIVVF